MTFVVWVAVLGGVLLALALTSSYLRWMPVTTSAVCLLLGVAIGPSGLNLLKLSLEGLSSSVEEFEKTHPKLVGVVNAISKLLSDVGI